MENTFQVTSSNIFADHIQIAGTFEGKAFEMRYFFDEVEYPITVDGDFTDEERLQIVTVWENARVKKFSEWKGSLSEFLQIGDLVDEEFQEYFINVLPPACMTSNVIQIGEPYSHINGRATYSTLKRIPDGWAYAGHLHRGGEAPEIKVKCIGEDDWNRKLYKNISSGAVYASVDGRLHTITEEGEPESPLKKELNIIIVADEQSREVDGDD